AADHGAQVVRVHPDLELLAAAVVDHAHPDVVRVLHDALDHVLEGGAQEAVSFPRRRRHPGSPPRPPQGPPPLPARPQPWARSPWPPSPPSWPAWLRSRPGRRRPSPRPHRPPCATRAEGPPSAAPSAPAAP